MAGATTFPCFPARSPRRLTPSSSILAASTALPKLIEAAYVKGFDFIEVFTNLTRLDPALLDVFVRFNVSVATSFYSHDPVVHEAITQRAGGFQRTIINMQRVMIDKEVQPRVMRYVVTNCAPTHTTL